MKHIILIVAALFSFAHLDAQTITNSPEMEGVKCETINGHTWGYREIDDIVVGMTIYKDKDDYRNYYKILVFLNNLSEKGRPHPEIGNSGGGCLCHRIYRLSNIHCFRNFNHYSCRHTDGSGYNTG